MAHFETTIEIENEEVEINVEYKIYGGCSGTLETPPEDAEVELISITTTKNLEVEIEDLHEHIINSLELQAFEDAENKSDIDE